MSNRPDDTWKAEVWANAWNVAGDCGPCTVDVFAEAYFDDWTLLFPDHQRPDYLALRSVVRSALRSAGVAEW